MKKLLQNLTMFTLVLLGCTQWAQAETLTIPGDLVHTAAIQGGSNAALSTLDTETHYYNNWGSSAWAGQAYAGFYYYIPEGYVVTSATLTFYSSCGGSKNGRELDVCYLNGTGFDYENLRLIDKPNTYVGTVTDNLTLEKKTLDATDAVKALGVPEKDNYIVFVFGGAAAGGTLYGSKIGNYAPQLEIEIASASETTSYTVNFLDANNNILKSAVVYDSQLLGATVTASAEDMASFKSEDGTKKYLYVGGNTTITLDEDGNKNVINLVFREANVWKYTVNALNGGNFIKEIFSGTAFEGEVFDQPIPRLLNIDGTIYDAGIANNTQASKSVNMNDDNIVINVNMTKTSISDVIYFSEAEDIETLTRAEGSYVPARCSFMAGGYAAGDALIVELTPGTYKITTASYASSSTTFTFNAGEETVLSVTGTGSLTEVTSDAFPVEKNTTLTVKGGNASNALDYIYIVRTGDVKKNIELSSDYVYSTFSYNATLDFTDNADVEAYTATVNGETVELTKVDQVPAGTGILIKRISDNTSTSVSIIAEATSIPNNDLKAVTVEMDASALVAENAYILVDDNTFQKVGEATPGTLAVGKAYLAVPASTGAKTLKIDTPTEVVNVAEKAEKSNDVIYNIQGIRVDKVTTPGLYIINGKTYKF